MADTPNLARRRLLGAIAAAPLLAPALGQAQQARPATRVIPSSGEALPLVGLGSWITFNVGDDRPARDACAEVMLNFFLAGGRLIDSSPMYGSAQDVIGYGLMLAAAKNRVRVAHKAGGQWPSVLVDKEGAGEAP